MTDQGQRTEKATPRKVERARREGRFPASRELAGGVQFLAFALLLGAFGGQCYSRLAETMRESLKSAFVSEVNEAKTVQVAHSLVQRVGLPLGLFGAALVFAALGTQLAATRFGFAAKMLAPNFQRLNILQRLRQLPRQNAPAFLQALLLLPLFAMAVYGVIKDNLASLLVLPLQSVEQCARQMAGSIQDLVWKAAGLFVVLGAFDYWRQHRRYMADLRMTKQEVREEAKELEANPQVKARIRRLRREWLRRRMMREVPKATAVIVNPTHYAVAIRYALETMSAPVVVAKGKNYLAMLIRKKAVEHQVPVVENPPLAQALYKSTEIGQEIPAHLYRAVAEILAYIYRLMGDRLPA